jgi:hypothetical protein
VRTGGVGDRSLRIGAITRHEVGAQAALARRRERARGEVVAREREHECSRVITGQDLVYPAQPVAERGAAVRAAVERLAAVRRDALQGHACRVSESPNTATPRRAPAGAVRAARVAAPVGTTFPIAGSGGIPEWLIAATVEAEGPSSPTGAVACGFVRVERCGDGSALAV